MRGCEGVNKREDMMAPTSTPQPRTPSPYRYQSIDGDDVSSLEHIADALVAGGKPDEAVRHLRALTTLTPVSSSAYFRL